MDFFSSKATGSPSPSPQKTESEAIKAQLAKIQELAARNKQLTNELTVLKSSSKGGTARDAPEVVAELNRKDDLLQRMKREAKQVIDTLKTKHQGEIEEARKGAGAAAPAKPASSQSPQTKGGGPASAVGGIPEASAHVAALTRELMQLKDELVASQEACRQAGERAREAEEGARAAQEEFEVSRQWGQADVEAAQANAAAEKSRADELASECAKKDATVARIKEEAHKILAAQRADREQAAALEKRMSDTEARHKEEVARLEGKLAEQERIAEGWRSEAEERGGRVEELEGELAAARDKVVCLEGEVGRLGGVVEELEGRLKEGDDLKRKVGELEGGGGGAEKEAGLLRERAAELEAELTEARQQVVSLEGEIGDLRGRLGELEGAVGASKAEKVHDAEEKAAAAKQVIEEAKRRVKEAEARAEDASAASAKAAEEGAALRGELEEVGARVREAEAERDSVREACVALEAEVERLSALHQEWQRQQGDGASAAAAQAAVLEQRNAELEGVVARSEREKEEVAALLGKQTEAVLELEKRVRAAESAAEGKGEELDRYVKAAEELGSIRGKLEVDLREKKAALKEKEEEGQRLRARCDEVEGAVQKKTDTIKMIKAEADKSIQKQVSMLKEKESKIGDLEGALASRDERIEAMAAMRDQQAAEVASLKELADSVPFLRQRLDEAAAWHQDGGVVQQELANLRETEAGLRSEVERLHGLLERAHSDLQSASSQVESQVRGELGEALEVAVRERDDANNKLAEALGRLETVTIQLEQQQQQQQQQQQIGLVVEPLLIDAMQQGSSSPSPTPSPGIQRMGSTSARKGKEPLPLENGARTGSPGPRTRNLSSDHLLPPHSPRTRGTSRGSTCAHHFDSWSEMILNNADPSGGGGLDRTVTSIQDIASRFLAGGGGDDLRMLVREMDALRPVMASRLPMPVGETIEAHTWEELCMLLHMGSTAASGSGAHNLVFAGVRDDAAGLATSAQRMGSQCVYQEREILDAWRRSSSGALPAGAGAVESAILGHNHGLPTRMIDFYHNALDAIHVATLGAKNKHGAVWAVNPTSCHSTCKAYQGWTSERSSPLTPKVLGPDQFTAIAVSARGGRAVDCFVDDAEQIGASLVFISVPPSCDRGHVYLASGVAMGGSVGGENRVLGVVGKPDIKADEWLQGGGGAAWRRVVIPPSLKAVARARLDEMGITERGKGGGLRGIAKFIRRTHSAVK